MVEIKVLRLHKTTSENGDTEQKRKKGMSKMIKLVSLPWLEVECGFDETTELRCWVDN